MKRKIALLFATLASTLPCALQADTVESNVSIALKYYFNFSPPANNNNNVQTEKFTTTTFKNADFIRAINAANNTTYLIKSRILRRDQFNPEGVRVGAPVYFLRDANIGDVDITEYMEVLRRANAYNKKFSTTKKTGTMSLMGDTEVRLIANPEFPIEAEDFNLRGVDRQTTKYVFNPKTKNFVELTTLSINLAGRVSFVIRGQGSVDAPAEGTFKISAAKIVKQAL